MVTKKRKLVRNLSIFTVTVAGFLFLAGFLIELFIPRFIDLPELKFKIEESIRESTGIRAEIDTLRIRPTLFDGVLVVFDNNILYDPEDLKVVRAGQINVNVRYFPLIYKKTSISKIAFNNIRVFVGEKSFLFRLKKPKVPSKDVFIEDAEVEFNNYDIIVDRYFDGLNKYKLDGNYLSLRHLNSTSPLVLEGSGSGYYGQKEPNRWIGRFNLQGSAKQDIVKKTKLDWKDFHSFHLELANVKLPTISHIVQSYSFPLKATGNVDYLFFDIHGVETPKQLAIQGATNTNIEADLLDYHFHLDPGRMIFGTDLALNPQMTVASLDNLSLQLQSNRFKLASKGKIILKRTFEESLLDINTKTNWLSVKSLALVPTLNDVQKKLLAHLDGNFATDISLKGIAKKPTVTGLLKLDHLEMTDFNHPKKNLVSDLNGVIRIVSPGWYKIHNLSGLVAKSPLAMNADINTKNHTLNGKLIVNGLHLGDFRQLLLQLSPNQPLLKALSMEGRLSLELAAKGKLEAPQLFGEAHLNRSQIFMAKHPFQLAHQLEGDLLFDSMKINIAKLQGFLGEAPITLHGNIYRSTNNSLDLWVQGQRVDLGHIQHILLALSTLTGTHLQALETVDLSGKTDLDLKLTGPLKTLSIFGPATIKDAGLKSRQKQLALHRINGKLDFEGATVTIPKLTGQLAEIPFVITGKLSDHFRSIQARLQSSNLNLSALQDVLTVIAPQLKQTLQLAGHADVDLLFSGPTASPQPKGTLTLKQAQVVYVPKKLTVQNMTGSINLSETGYTLSNLQASAQGVLFHATGSIGKAFKPYKVDLTASNVAVKNLQTLIATFSPAAAASLQQAGIQSGLADLNLTLADSMPSGLGGTVTLKNVSAQPAQLGAPLKVSALKYDLQSGKLQFPASGIQLADLKLKVQGFASAQGYHFFLSSQNIPISFLRDNRALFDKLLPFPMPTLYNTQGAMQIQADISPRIKELVIRFLNAGASAKELKYPLYDMNGTLNLALSSNKVKAFSDNLAFRYANSPVKTNFDVNGLQDIYLEATGTLSPLLVNDILLTNRSTLTAYAAVPFDINLSGKLGNLSGAGTGNDFHMFFNFNIASLFSNPTLENPEEAGDASLNQANLSSVIHLLGNTLKVEETRFKISDDSSVLIKGQIDRLFDKKDRQIQLSLLTEPILDLEAWAKQVNEQLVSGLSGKIFASLNFKSTDTDAGAEGKVAFDHVRSAALEIEDLNGQILFEGIKALLKIDHFQSPGVDVAFTGTVDNVLQYPLPISDFNLVGKQFIVSLYSEWMNRVIVGKIRKGFWEQFFPSTGKVGSLPFEIKSGTIQLEEGIINNLIVENFTSNFHMYPNTFFELDNIQADSAGGKAKGYFSMNPRENNFMTIHLNIDKMKANAVTRIFLNVTNQIFGDLSGLIDYTTEGLTSEEMLSNTNGSANLVIENGRLPAIAKMENLLVAANTISGGLANLNLNSLFRIAAPFHTDYFATLSGTFKMVQGIIYTDDMKSDGQNLDLLISGTIRMVDGDANLTVRGQMDREIGGVLGPLGKLSFGHFLGILPPLRKIIGFIPGLGFVPGFGGPGGEKGIAFEVKVNGPATDPGAIQDFKWAQ